MGNTGGNPGAPAAMPSPALIFQTLNGYHATAALKAGIELDLFSVIAGGNTNAHDIAAATGAAERGIAILADSLTVLGLLTKHGDRYSLSPDSAAFLDRRSPVYLGDAAFFLTNPDMTAAFATLTTAVRKGGTALPGKGSVDANDPVWVDFARYMAPMMALQAEAVAGCLAAAGLNPTRVLDIAAGHGMFGIAVARRFPASELHALDWQAVLEVAKANATKAGVGARFHPHQGDAFTTSLGENFDLVLVPNFLHHFDPEVCIGFLRRVHVALRPGGRLAIVEFVPNEDRVSPPGAALFALIMLASTPAGTAYTASELERMLSSAGFASPTPVPLPGGMQQLWLGTRTA